MNDAPHNPTRRPTLVGRLLRTVLPVVLLSLLLVGGVNYFVARDQIAHDIRNEIQTLAEQVAVNVRTFVEQRGRDLETIAENPLLVDYYMNAAYGLDEEAQVYQEELRRYFAKFADRTRAYEAILYFDAGGELVAGVEHGEIIESYSGIDLSVTEGRSTYRSLIQGNGEGGGVGGEHGKTITLATRLRDEAGVERGTIVLVCDLDPVASMLARTQVGRSGTAYLEGYDGETLLGGRPEGEPDLRQTAPVAAAPWRVVVEAHSADFVAPLIYLRNLTIFYSLGVAALVTLLISGGIRRATRPIDQMADGTRRLAAGELDYRFPVPPLRELAPLAGAFNDMAGNLKRRDEQLEARIRQLSALRMIEAAATRREDEETLLRTCLEAVARGLDFDRAGLYWVDEEAGEIVGRFAHFRRETGFTEQTLQSHRIPINSDDVLAQVVRDRQPAMVLHPHGNTELNQRLVQESETIGFIAAPLCGKDRVFGVICTDNCLSGRPLEESDRDGLSLFAATAGLALENATLLQRIAESEARHRTVVENSPIAILGLSRDQRITTWNRGAETIFGYGADWIIGRPLLELFADAARGAFDQLVMRVVQEGAVREYPIQGRTRGGRTLDLTVSWGGERPEFWENDEWAVVIRDVTDARELQQQLIRSEKLSAAGQLISGIAHELNNPLQAVLGYAQLLKSDRNPEAAHAHVRHIHGSATRCRRIIDNLLLFVRQGGVEKRSVNVASAARASIELLEHKLRKAARVELVTEYEEERPYVRANFQQVEQVLINLIGNACDALEDWSGQRRVYLRVLSAGPRVRVEVADTGPGVPPEARDQLFEPFFTTKGEGRGTGLGLPLCRQIVSEHGGELRLGDREGGGSVFYFELERVAQAAGAEAEAVAGGPSEEPESGSEPAGLPGGGVVGKRVLLVDDEPSVRALLRDVLTAAGCRVEAVESLEAAGAQAAGGAFDLILTDVHLDDGSGVDLLQQWGEWSAHPRPPFLFLTGDIVSEPLRELGDEPSGVRVLQKPVDLRELRAVVAELLSGAPEARRNGVYDALAKDQAGV